MEKMTYAKALDAVLTGAEITAEVREKLEALKTSVEKKNTTERKPIGKGQAVAVPGWLDWELWQGPAPRREPSGCWPASTRTSSPTPCCRACRNAI